MNAWRRCAPHSRRTADVQVDAIRFESLAEDALLLSANLRDYQRVPDGRVEN